MKLFRKLALAAALASALLTGEAAAQTYSSTGYTDSACIDKNGGNEHWTQTFVAWTEGVGPLPQQAALCIRAFQVGSGLITPSGNNYTVSTGRAPGSSDSWWGFEVAFFPSVSGPAAWNGGTNDWTLTISFDKKGGNASDACADSIGQPPCTKKEYTLPNSYNEGGSSYYFYVMDPATDCPSFLSPSCYWENPYSNSNTETMAELVTFRAIKLRDFPLTTFDQSVSMCVSTTGLSC